MTMELVRERFPGEIVGEGAHAGQPWVEVERERVVEILRALRDEGPYEILTDLTAVDWLNEGRRERFCVVYNLYSLTHNRYFRVKAWVPETDPVIDTAVALWGSANWAEREVWDLFGITFRGHPDLKRILMPDTYTGFPLRKDYPLTGKGERYEFANHRRPGVPPPPRRD